MSDTVLVALIAAVPSTLAAIAALLGLRKAKEEVRELRIAINGRLTQLLELTRLASKAEGREEERLGLPSPLAPGTKGEKK